MTTTGVKKRWIKEVMASAGMFKRLNITVVFSEVISFTVTSKSPCFEFVLKTVIII